MRNWSPLATGGPSDGLANFGRRKEKEKQSFSILSCQIHVDSKCHRDEVEQWHPENRRHKLEDQKLNNWEIFEAREKNRPKVFSNQSVGFGGRFLVDKISHCCNVDIGLNG